MNNSNDQIIVGNHEVKVFERSQIMLTGIKKIISFDNEEFLMESSMGMILLKGEGLEIIRLDTHDGNVKIKGVINSFSYIEEKNYKNKDDGFIAKLFK